MRPRPPVIAVCGASHASDREYQLAHECGALLARHGATVLNGGLGGVMAASAAGARSEGGICIGLLPGVDPDAANDDVTFALATGMGEMRNALIARCCAAMIAIGGGSGTLSEIAFASRIARPVALLESWELRGAGGSDITESMLRAATPAEAVDWVLFRLRAATDRPDSPGS
jgi:uncharacterized protein (TIGR00725 family)